MKLKEKRRKDECPECESKMTYVRLKTKTFVCRKCRTEWPAGKSGK